MYFTSWDANVFLCLLSVFPEEVVRRMIKLVKETHEDYVQEESLEYWLTLPDGCGTIGRVGKANRGWWKKRKNLKEFKQMWKWRCPERRRVSVVDLVYCWDHTVYCTAWGKKHYESPGEGSSREGYWKSDEAWSYSILDRNLDTSEWHEDEEDEYFNMKEEQRRECVAEWYKNIHEGRFFLFFKENDIISNNVFDKHRNENKSICDISFCSQVGQDLLTIDGPGLGQGSGNHIEHIDDMFL